MPSEGTNRATTLEWRQLGFFYDRDDENKVWKLVGSRSGLFQFCDALLAFAADPKNCVESEHEHYGPYSYLEVMTWATPGFDQHSIHGPVQDISRLAVLIKSKLSTALPDSTITIREEFGSDGPYALVLELRHDGFDPASADTALTNGTASTPD